MSPSSILPQTEALLSYLGLFLSPTHLTWHRASVNIDRTPGPDVRTGVHVGTGTPLMSALARGPTCVVDICTPDARPEAEALDDVDVAPVEMLDAAAPPEAREAGMPLEAHKPSRRPRTC
ncbi:hypothetical protein B0H10DRAFT_2219895 [Mycena sp. CBHHK59/15]|nr:hypothetical protein B0H10DRAFT_2219895 [Mycena sp. CBHHK59/15]